MSEISCRTCDDEGVIEVEVTVTVASHAMTCTPDQCASECPIPEPRRELQQERCPDCGGQT